MIIINYTNKNALNTNDDNKLLTEIHLDTLVEAHVLWTVEHIGPPIIAYFSLNVSPNLLP